MKLIMFNDIKIQAIFKYAGLTLAIIEWFSSSVKL